MPAPCPLSHRQGCKMSDTLPTICLLGQEDAEHIADIEGRCFDTAWDEAMYRRVLPPARMSLEKLVALGATGTLPVELLVFGYCLDNTLAGYISIRPILAIHYAEVYNVAILPSLQGQGRGHALLSRAVETLESMGITEMNLEVRAGNAPAIALYAKNGFVPCGLRKNYYPDSEDALLMERILR